MFVVSFHGGFANQLFQYAFYLKLQEDYPTQKCFADISAYRNCKIHGGFKLNNFVKFNYLIFKEAKNDFIKITENNYFSTEIIEGKNYIFDGYWQKIDFFPNDLSYIYKIFSETNLLKKNIDISKRILQSNSVAIHVRRGDYMNHFLHGNIANKIYFQNAISYIEQKIELPVFFVFSDDLEWCKEHLCFHDHQVFFVGGNDNAVEQDIILMSLCRCNIVSNSSFSWWGAYLNKNDNKIILMPEYWFNQKTISVDELQLENAVRIPNTPYVDSSVLNPFFSIVVSVCSVNIAIRRLFASLLNQTFTNIEIIIIEDFESYKFHELIKSYEVRDKRIKIFQQDKNSGRIASRIAGEKLSAGKYILFLNEDNWLELNACEKIYKELKNTHNVDILDFGYIQEPFRSKHAIKYDKDDRFDSLLKNGYSLTFFNSAYKNDILKKSFNYIESFKVFFADELFFTFVIAFFAKTYSYIDEYLIHSFNLNEIVLQSEYSAEKFKQIVNDYKIVLDHLTNFAFSNSFEYKISIKNFNEIVVSHLSCVALKFSDPVIVLKSFYIIDVTFGTSFFDEYVLEQEKKLNNYYMLKKLDFLGICKFIIKYLVKKIRKL